MARVKRIKRLEVQRLEERAVPAVTAAVFGSTLDVFGDAGRDLLRGGRGLADTLVGGPGADKLVGVKAVDVVAFDPLDTFSMAADPGVDPMAISAAALAANACTVTAGQVGQLLDYA